MSNPDPTCVTLEFTYDLFLLLGRAYEEALAQNKESFSFQGHTLLTAYAKYVLQYLSTHFGPFPTTLS